MEREENIIDRNEGRRLIQEATFRKVGNQRKTQSFDAELIIRGKQYDFSIGRVMGILNATPDSFYSASRCQEAAEACRRAGAMLEAGADIIDIGGCSTRPGASLPSAEEEIERLRPVLEAIRGKYPDAVISVDTFRSKVARECAERWQVDIINDISGGLFDPEMAPTVAETGCGYVLMHTRGLPDDMATRTDYEDGVVAGVLRETAFRVDEFRQAGVCNIIIDPGFGFAKTIEQNYELLDRLDAFKIFDAPILAGVSRKSMIWRPLGISPEEALPGTTALGMASLMKGASILRVHDVEAAVQTVKVFRLLQASAERQENVIDIISRDDFAER